MIDKDGNAVALTSSVGNPFGSAVVAPGTGFPLNDELPASPSGIDLPEGGKRHRSSQSPTIVVKDGEPVLVTGGAGSTTILSGTTLSVSNLIDFRMDVPRSIDAARIRAERCCGLDIEDTRVLPSVLAELVRRGHALTRTGEYGFAPIMQLAGSAGDDYVAASDPRDELGVAAAPGVRRCLARRSPIGPRNIGRIRLRYTRRRLLRVRVKPIRRTRRSYRYCVKRSSGRVAAVFSSRSRRGRARLVTTTATGHGNRRVRVRSTAARFRRAYPNRRRIGRGLYRAGPRSPRLLGLRRGRVRFIAVADRRLLRSRRALRRYVRLAGL